MSFWTPGLTLETIEQIAIEQAYRFYKENKTHTALSLKMSPRTLAAKLEKYDADRCARQLINDKLQKEREHFLARQRGQSVPSTDTGIRMESDVKTAPESQVSVSKREEIQEVLSQPSSKSSVKRAG